MIEEGTSNALVTVRNELVGLYALAFQVIEDLEQNVFHLRQNSMKASAVWPYSKIDVRKMLEGIESRNERLKMVMEIARPQNQDQGLSREGALFDRMHRELSAGMQQEVHRGFQTLEESIQNRLEQVEQRVIVSVRDVLPGIIHEEMRNLQKDSASSDDRT